MGCYCKEEKDNFCSIPTLWLENEFSYYSTHYCLGFMHPLFYFYSQRILTICILQLNISNHALLCL